jgi:hypothetical protein
MRELAGMDFRLESPAQHGAGRRLTHYAGLGRFHPRPIGAAFGSQIRSERRSSFGIGGARRSDHDRWRQPCGRCDRCRAARADPSRTFAEVEALHALVTKALDLAQLRSPPATKKSLLLARGSQGCRVPQTPASSLPRGRARTRFSWTIAPAVALDVWRDRSGAPCPP